MCVRALQQMHARHSQRHVDLHCKLIALTPNSLCFNACILFLFVIIIVLPFTLTKYIRSLSCATEAQTPLLFVFVGVYTSS